MNETGSTGNLVAAGTAPTDPRRIVVREIRAAAAQETINALRDRRQILVRAITPLLLFGALAAVTLALRGPDISHPDPYRVGVQGDLSGAQKTLQNLRPDRLQFVPTDDAHLAALFGVDLGMHVPDGLDDQLARGIPVQIDIYTASLEGPSRAAASLVRSGLTDSAMNTAARFSPKDGRPSGSFTLDVVDVQRTTTGTRDLTSQIVSGLLVVQAALLVAGTANRFASRRGRGQLLADLLLPLTRLGIAGAKACGELVIGMVTAAPVIFIVMAFAAFVGARSNEPGTVVLQLIAVAVTLVALFVPFTAAGLVIGAAARTPEQVTLGTGAMMIVAAVVASVVAMGPSRRATWTTVIPVVGSVGALRDVLEGTGGAPAMLIATTTSLAIGVALIAWAGRVFDSERMIMRGA